MIKKLIKKTGSRKESEKKTKSFNDLIIKDEWYKNNMPIESDNEQAVNVLTEFINGDSSVIGLMGDYGSGKSSVIKKLVKENPKVKFYILSIPNYLDIKEIKKLDQSIVKQEVRKSISMQLISLFEGNSEINSIKKKLYMHNFDKLSIKELIAFSTIILMIVIRVNLDYFLETYKYIRQNERLFFGLGFILFTILLFYVLYRVGTYIKNTNITDYRINNVGFKQKNPETYIDYDLETIVTLIEVIANGEKNKIFKKSKDIVIVIEDVDRYERKEIFQEIMHIVNACRKTKFILPMKHSMFESAIEQSKYFDSQYSLLPINDKMTIYEYIEDSLSEHEEIDVDASVLIQTSSYIEDFRTFHTIYNNYLSLIVNYKKMYVLKKETLNELYSTAVLQTFLPDDLKNIGSSKSGFIEFTDVIFNKKNIENELLNNYNKRIVSNKNLVNSYKVENEELNSAINNARKVQDEKVTEILNIDFYLQTSSNTTYYIDIGQSRELITTIRNNIINRKYYSFDQIQEIIPQIRGGNLNLDMYEKFMDNGVINNNQKTINSNEEKIKSAVLDIENTEETISKIRVDITNLSCSALIIKYELKYFVENKFDLCISEDSEKCKEYKELILNLIMNGLFTEEYKKYISILKDEIPKVKLREFKYDISGKLRSYIYINDKEIEFNVDQGFIDLFSVYEFSKAKFVKKSIIEFLINNIEIINNRKKLDEIFKQLCQYLSEDKEFSFDNASPILSEKQNEVFLLLEYISNIKKVRNTTQRDFILYSKLGELYKLCNTNISLKWLNNMVNSIYETDVTGFVPYITNTNIMWKYIEYNIAELNKETFTKLLEYIKFTDPTSSACSEIFSNIESIYTKLYSYMFDNQAEYEKILVSQKTFTYNKENVEYLLQKRFLCEEILFKEDEKFINYICNNKILPNSMDINRLYKLPLIIGNIDNIYSLCNTYSSRVVDLNIFDDNISEAIIQEKIYSLNDTNKLYIIGKNDYKELLDNFNLEKEGMPITNEVAIDIVKYLNINEMEEESIDNFIYNIEYKYDITDVTNLNLLERLIKNNRVLSTVENYKTINNQLAGQQLTFIQNVDVKDFISFGLETSEYDKILNQLFDAEDYNYVNMLYLSVEQSTFDKFNHNLNVDVNIQIILNNNLEEETVECEFSKYNHKTIQSTFKTKLVKKSVSKYLMYFTPRFSDIDIVVSYINSNYSFEQKLDIIIAMVRKNQINNKDEIIEVMQKFEIWSYFKFPHRGRGVARDINVEFEVEEGIFNKICEILVKFNYLKKYNYFEGKIYRK